MKFLSIYLWGLMMLTISSISATELNIKVTDIDVNRGGNIIVMIFAEDGFPKKHDKALFAQTNKAQQEVIDFKFDLDLEEFAVKVLHDENEDGKVSKNWTGIYPREGLGFSNGQKVSMSGAPKYKKSKLLKEQTTNGLTIAVLYP